MALHRKPVPQGPRPMTPSHSNADSTTPAARPVSEHVRGTDHAKVDLDRFGADDLAPALALMDVNEPTYPISDGQLGATAPVKHHAAHHRIPRSSLDKPLPEAPDAAANDEVGDGSIRHYRHSKGDSAGAQSEHRSKQDVARELGVANVLDLNDSEDTIYHRRQAPAVTHETIVQPVHEVQHEVYERDIHEHHEYHRILPVQEVEVLPARHFVEDAHGRHHEVRADQVPGRSPQFTDRLLEEVFKHSLPEVGDSVGPRKFTARQFTGAQGDSKQSVGPTGTVHTEQWWVHPPMLQQPDPKDEDVYPVSIG